VKLAKRTARIYNLRDIAEAPFADYRTQRRLDDFDAGKGAVNQPGGVDPAWKALSDAVHDEARTVARRNVFDDAENAHEMCCDASAL